MAQRRLAHPEPPARPRHAVLLHHAVEDHEQVQIERPPIHSKHLHVTKMNLLHCSARRSVRHVSTSITAGGQDPQAPAPRPPRTLGGLFRGFSARGGLSLGGVLPPAPAILFERRCCLTPAVSPE